MEALLAAWLAIFAGHADNTFDCKPPFYRGCNMEQPDVRNDPGPSYAVPQEQPPAVEPDPEDPDKGHGNDPDGNDGDNPGKSEGPGGDRC